MPESDTGHNTEIYSEQGGLVRTVGTAGEMKVFGTLSIQDTGSLDVKPGGAMKAAGTQAAAIADVATAGAATAAANATAINSILAALRGLGIIATA